MSILLNICCISFLAIFSIFPLKKEKKKNFQHFEPDGFPAIFSIFTNTLTKINADYLCRTKKKYLHIPQPLISLEPANFTNTIYFNLKNTPTSTISKKLINFQLQSSFNFCNNRVEPTEKNINTHRQNIKKYMKIIEEKKGSPIFHKRQINSNNSNCPTCAQFYEKSNHISPFQLKLQI